MDWIDEGIVLGARPYGESAAIVTLLTREHGRHMGLVHGGASRAKRPLLQAGNRVKAAWRARLAEHLGTYSCEMVTAHAALLLEDPLKLTGLTAACAVADGVLPEREPHPAIFAGFEALLTGFQSEAWPVVLVHLELGLLKELGFRLDLERCAVSGVTEELVYVSPRSGRAVSREAGAPYAERLLALPGFLVGGSDYSTEEILRGLDLTGHFIERHLFWPRNRGLPEARLRLAERLRALVVAESAEDAPE
jgi:DNA repair protein RecO (recombination protein O)